jgi:transcriptional regulator with GAF, ATPase, and Fis domain
MAYLVIQEDNKWSDVFRLIIGRRVTIGRSPTNTIVVRSEQVSRYHAEIFHAEGHWLVRDLDSRNGTSVEGIRLVSDHLLENQQAVQIGKSVLTFYDQLPAQMGLDDPPTLTNIQAQATEAGLVLEDIQDSNGLLTEQETEPPQIVHRKHETELLNCDHPAEAGSSIGRSAWQLCRLAFSLAGQTTFANAARLALDGLFENTGVSAGAIWLVRSGSKDQVPDLDLVASRSDQQLTYRRISSYLARTVTETGEAILAQDIADDSNIGLRDSKGEILAQSVICAPLRVTPNTGTGPVQVRGLIHLYTTEADQCLTADDLDFTLAVADNLSLAYKSLSRQQKMSEVISVTRREITQLRERLGSESEIVGSGPAMQLVHQQVAQVAPTNATVLVRGESGVGKELVARAIHFASHRNKGPFICLNCAALSESLLESELFGHEKGAFTGATEKKMGKFESADGGTLMLDEIGEMSAAIQAKFLRVLEGHPFERVGGSKPIKVNVRVIAATNRDLEQAVQQGNFRKDLYFRLKVVEIEVPALRKRREDVVEIADYFLVKFCSELGKRHKRFSHAALERLRHYRWPGNVRELKNVVERAVVLSTRDTIDVDELALSNLRSASETNLEIETEGPFEPITLDEMERRHILNVLNSTQWNKSKTATILGVERSTLDRKIKRYDLERFRVG